LEPRHRGLLEGEKIARTSVVVTVGIGVIEVIIGIVSGSIALIADGIHSFADAFVSFIVWLGLKISRRAPDGKFHFGYYRVETFSAILAALIMIGVGAIILYGSYLAFLTVREVLFPVLAMTVTLLAAIVSLALAFYKRRIAKRIDSLSLAADVYNTIADGLTSLIAFSGVFFSYLGLPQTDAIAGMIIAGFLFVVTFSIIKEASLVLMDACTCPEVVETIRQTTESVEGVKGVRDIKLRKLGSFIIGEMHIEVDGNISVYNADAVVTKIEKLVKDQIVELEWLTIKVKPATK